MFNKIVKKLHSVSRLYTDGYTKAMREEMNAEIAARDAGMGVPPQKKIFERSNLFDYISEMIDDYRCEKRIQNVIRFTAQVLDDIIISSLDDAANI